MTADQIKQAKQQLITLKPNILKFVEQNTEIVTLLTDESIWFATVNVGIEDRVKDAGGPEVRTFVPKREWLAGWMARCSSRCCKSRPSLGLAGQDGDARVDRQELSRVRTATVQQGSLRPAGQTRLRRSAKRYLLTNLR